MVECGRCGNFTDTPYTFEFRDDVGNPVHWKICWDCDFEVSNGHDPFADVSEILFDRAQIDHDYDPVNEPDPNEKRID